VNAVDRWRSTWRSLRWWPLICAPVLASGALLVTWAYAGPNPARLAFIGGTGRTLVCVAVAFVADDPATATAPAVPVSPRARLLVRLVPGSLVAVGGWLAVVGLEHRLGSGAADVHTDAVGSICLAAFALGAALMAARRFPACSPGAIGAAIAVAATAAVVAVPAWTPPAPDASVARAAIAALSSASAWRSTAEPAR
jgi:hypothetical protein